MIAAPAQLFNELGKYVKITKSAVKLLLDVVLAPDLQEQLSFCIARMRPFSAIFSRTLGRLTTRLRNISLRTPPSTDE